MFPLRVDPLEGKQIKEVVELLLQKVYPFTLKLSFRFAKFLGQNCAEFLIISIETCRLLERYSQIPILRPPFGISIETCRLLERYSKIPILTPTFGLPKVLLVRWS